LCNKWQEEENAKIVIGKDLLQQEIYAQHVIEKNSSLLQSALLVEESENLDLELTVDPVLKKKDWKKMLRKKLLGNNTLKIIEKEKDLRKLKREEELKEIKILNILKKRKEGAFYIDLDLMESQKIFITKNVE